MLVKLYPDLVKLCIYNIYTAMNGLNLNILNILAQGDSYKNQYWVAVLKKNIMVYQIKSSEMYYFLFLLF